MLGSQHPPYSARNYSPGINKKGNRFSSNYWTNPTHNEKLKKVLAEVDFVKSLPTYFTSVWKTSKPRSWDERPREAKPCHFFRLPPGLRVAIYTSVLKKPYTVHLRERNQNVEQRLHVPSIAGPALARVSREVRREALPIYFYVNKFLLHTPLRALGHTASWLERNMLLCGSSVPLRLRFQVDHCQWTEFSRVQQLVDLLASGKVKLDISGIDLSSPTPKQGSDQSKRLFMVNDGYGGLNIVGALEQAVLLGTSAYEQQWSAGKLSLQFEVLRVLTMPLEHLEMYKRMKNRLKKADEGSQREKLGPRKS